MNPLQKLFSHIVRQTDDLNFETFLFRFFSWLKKNDVFRLHFFYKIDSKNDVVNEDCYQQKRFLFFVLPSSRSNIVETRENK